jgi:DoxX-like family
VRVAVASARGILGGWLLKATLPLLVSPHAIAEWTAAGVGDPARVALAVVELLGAVLFAFEWTAVVGFLLLTLSFAYAVAIHIQHGEMPWWIVCSFIDFWTKG